MTTNPTTTPIVLSAPPHAPFRAWVAERLFRHAAKDLPVTVSFPDGATVGRDGPELRCCAGGWTPAARPPS